MSLFRKAILSFFVISFSFPSLRLLAADLGGCKAALANLRIEIVSAERFFDVLSQLQDMPFLRRRSLEEYQDISAKGGQLYLMGNALTGYGIKGDGLLISVFNESGIKGLGAFAVRDAIQRGATSLLCADGPLRNYYETFGFQVVERIPMSPENAGYHLNWPNGIRPDMLRMSLEATTP